MTQLALRLPVYSGGRLSSSLASAEMERTRSCNTSARRHRLPHAARLLALLAQEAQTIADDAVKAAQQHARSTAQLSREGRTVVSDKLTAEVSRPRASEPNKSSPASRPRVISQAGHGPAADRDISVAAGVRISRSCANRTRRQRIALARRPQGPGGDARPEPGRPGTGAGGARGAQTQRRLHRHQ
jgi:hypothetical protein